MKKNRKVIPKRNYFLILIMLLFLTTGVKAMGYCDIKLPRFRGVYKTSQQTKEIFNVSQTIETQTARSSWNWNDHETVNVRLYKYYHNSGYTDWMSAPEGVQKTFTNNSTKNEGEYRLELKNTAFAPSQVRYWGNWALY